jgi:hypothetical protein
MAPMSIPGILDDHLERLHVYLGPGKGSEYYYKHIPSEIMVGGTKPPQMKIHEYEKQLLADLAEKLKAAGLINSTEPRTE